MLTLARFSEAFLVLRAQDVGLRIALVPLVMVVMSVVYALASYPAGVLADRTDRRTLLAVGFAVLIAADLVLAGARGVAAVMVGAALWGLHMGLTQGLLATLVADTCPAGPSRQRLRPVQSRQRARVVCSERRRRPSVGWLWRARHLPGRCRIHCSVSAGAAAPAAQGRSRRGAQLATAPASIASILNAAAISAWV